MADIIFPVSPSDGDTFEVGNTVYIYNAAKQRWEATPDISSILIGLNIGRASSVPTTGNYQQGGFIFNNIPSISSGKILLGWSRLTSGNTHVLGTDWSPVYVTTS